MARTRSASAADIRELARGKGSSRDRIEAGNPDTAKRMARARRAVKRAKKRL